MNQNSFGVVLVCIPFRGVPFLATPEVSAWDVLEAGVFPFLFYFYLLAWESSKMVD